MLTDEQLKAVERALDDKEIGRDGILNLADPQQIRELCMRAGLPKDVTDEAVRDACDA